MTTAHGLPSEAQAVLRDCRVLVRGKRQPIVEVWRGGLVEAVGPGSPTLPRIGYALERAQALLALASSGRPVYFCSCRVE